MRRVMSVRSTTISSLSLAKSPSRIPQDVVQLVVAAATEEEYESTSRRMHGLAYPLPGHDWVEEAGKFAFSTVTLSTLNSLLYLPQFIAASLLQLTVAQPTLLASAVNLLQLKLRLCINLCDLGINADMETTLGFVTLPASGAALNELSCLHIDCPWVEFFAEVIFWSSHLHTLAKLPKLQSLKLLVPIGYYCSRIINTGLDHPYLIKLQELALSIVWVPQH